MVNAMLINLRKPQKLWRDAILTVNYLLNKVPKKVKKKNTI